MTYDNPELATSQQKGGEENSETSSVESSQKTSQTIQEKIDAAVARIDELQLLIKHWKS